MNDNDINEVRACLSDEEWELNAPLVQDVQSIRAKFAGDLHNRMISYFGPLSKYGIRSKTEQSDCTINLPCAFKMHQLIRDNHCSRILNFGTGTGSSIAIQLQAMQSFSSHSLTSLDNHVIFEPITRMNLHSVGYAPETYRLKTIPLVPVQKNWLYDEFQPCFEKKGVFGDFFKRYMHKAPKEMLTYAIKLEKDTFDFALIDGPAGTDRFVSFLLAIHCVRAGGIIAHEMSKHMVIWYKSRGLRFHEFGRFSRAMTIAGKEYKAPSISWLVVDDNLKKQLW